MFAVYIDASNTPPTPIPSSRLNLPTGRQHAHEMLEDVFRHPGRKERVLADRTAIDPE